MWGGGGGGYTGGVPGIPTPTYPSPGIPTAQKGPGTRDTPRRDLGPGIPIPTPCRENDTHLWNITFPQLRWQAVITDMGYKRYM